MLNRLCMDDQCDRSSQSISWISGATSKWGKERGKEEDERGKDERKHPQINLWLRPWFIRKEHINYEPTYTKR